MIAGFVWLAEGSPRVVSFVVLCLLDACLAYLLRDVAVIESINRRLHFKRLLVFQ